MNNQKRNQIMINFLVKFPTVKLLFLYVSPTNVCWESLHLKLHFKTKRDYDISNDSMRLSYSKFDPFKW